MVPADSRRVSPAPRYSGSHYLRASLRLRGYHPLRPAFPGRSTRHAPQMSWSFNPGRPESRPVWAVPRSLATTCGITVVFSSWAYLDVSVRPVSHPDCSGFKGLPHSETRGSAPLCGSPRLIAALRVLRRLPMPRHPPCALRNLVLSYNPCAGAARGRLGGHTLHLGTRFLTLHSLFAADRARPRGASPRHHRRPAY